MFKSSRKRFIAGACALVVVTTGLTNIAFVESASAVTGCSGTKVATKDLVAHGRVIGESVAYRNGKTACIVTNHQGRTYGKKHYTEAILLVKNSKGDIQFGVNSTRVFTSTAPLFGRN